MSQEELPHTTACFTPSGFDSPLHAHTSSKLMSLGSDLHQPQPQERCWLTESSHLFLRDCSEMGKGCHISQQHQTAPKTPHALLSECFMMQSQSLYSCHKPPAFSLLPCTGTCIIRRCIRITLPVETKSIPVAFCQLLGPPSSWQKVAEILFSGVKIQLPFCTVRQSAPNLSQWKRFCCPY